jgi:hypothetical protein
MKKSNLPFKILSVANFPILLSLFVVANACKTTKAIDKIVVANPPTSLPQIEISKSNLTNVGWIEIALSKSPHRHLRMAAKSCGQQKFLFGASMAVLGQSYDMVFEEEDEQLVLASVEDSETKLSGLEVSKDLQVAICNAQIDANNQPGLPKVIYLDAVYLAALENSIMAAMKKMVPDCASIVFGEKEASCVLQNIQPKSAIAATEEFQKVMIQKWRRQPYILARRAGVVTTLAKIAEMSQGDEAYLKFCRILKYSVPEELPVVMTSPRWQKALCSGQTKIRQEAALFGLAKGIQEMSLLRELYEETSKIGSLSVKIPLETIPGRAHDVVRQPLRITISPDESVSQALMAEAKKYLGRPDQEIVPRKLVRHIKHSSARRIQDMAQAQAQNMLAESDRAEMCWHPLFSSSINLLRIADGMKLTGNGFALECGYVYDHNSIAGAVYEPLSKYLIQSLSSETEFVLDNGQEKVLRLPEGHYKYTVHVLPANPLDEEGMDDKAAPKSIGELGWGNAQRHAIRSW